jgi:hypothetical protein
MSVDLTTTNVLLGILATISVLEALAVIGLFAGGYLLFRRLMKLLTEIEQRQVAPAAARVNDILDDVKTVTGAAKRAAESADRSRLVAGFRGRSPRIVNPEPPRLTRGGPPLEADRVAPRLFDLDRGRCAQAPTRS